MARIPRRAAARLAGGCALVLGLSLSGCAAPQYTVVSDPGGVFHFKVPRGWHQISGSSLASAMTAQSVDPGDAAIAAYQAGPAPKAAGFLSFDITRPFVFVEAGTLTATARRQMSDGFLRDFFLPVTSARRQQVATEGFPLTGFRQLRDQMLRASRGVHGVRETYDYTDVGQADTSDMDALTTADGSSVFLLIVHCTTRCYGNNRAEITYVMSSVTVSAPAQQRLPWAGLIGR